MSLDVLCLGLIVVDHVSAPLPRFPPPGGIELTDRLVLTIGGCAANTAVDLAKLDVRVGIGGVVGDDALGRFALEEFREQGVDCASVTVSRTAQTSATLVINVAGEDRRFLHAVGANAEFTGRTIPATELESARVVSVGGIGLNPALSGPNVAELFRQARQSGSRTVLDVVVGDPARLPPLLQAALPQTDVFLPNEDEARAITGLSAPAEQARRFREWGARDVVITRGSRGALLLNDAGIREFGAHQVDCIDGTGGGDAFVAGYIYGMLHDAPPDRCVAYGSAMGASCVRAMGATTGVFSRQELEAFVAAHPLPAR